jgi:mono/diheme cytochrome c family protein
MCAAGLPLGRLPRRGPGILVGTVLFALAVLAVRGELKPDQAAQLPAPSPGKVSFSRDVKPILETACIKCHGRGRGQGGFSLETREAVLKGGRSGAAVVVEKSAGSYLIELVSGINPDNVMPKKGSRLTAAQVGVLRAWIDQGLLWDEQIQFNRPAPANLNPRKPALPAPAESSGSRNPIDLLLAPYFAAHGIKPASPAPDRILLRRLFLDAIGLLPSPAEQKDFEADSRPDKVERWVEKLLGRNAPYAAHWLTFWNDALRNDYQGTGYIDGGRRQISEWLYGALAQNIPYDRFVAQLVNPEPASEGFINGIVWRGVVNASQTPQMQAAQNMSHVFMGVNLKCASCHDSFISDWTLADAYGMAGIYADGPLEMVRCDKPTGQAAPVKFLFPQLGSIDSGLDSKQRRARLAEIMTQKQNGRLTRTIVNRLWARFMGRGLVEPVDEMDKPAWNQDLLDWLAEDLAERGFDLKKTITLILTSDAYRLPSRDAAAGAGEFVFQGPLVRRMGAEQFLDALHGLTRVWPERMANTNIAYAIAGPKSRDASAGGAAEDAGPVRSALVNNDALMTALGRPNREVVVTRRAEEATTLQALELTNGSTLAELLRKGARNWMESAGASPDLSETIFREALGRPPIASELALAVELTGKPVKSEGLEDLLWTIVMLPEFQLLY